MSLFENKYVNRLDCSFVLFQFQFLTPNNLNSPKYFCPQKIFHQTKQEMKETNLTTVRSELTSDMREGTVGDGDEFPPRTCKYTILTLLVDDPNLVQIPHELM